MIFQIVVSLLKRRAKRAGKFFRQIQILHPFALFKCIFTIEIFLTSLKSGGARPPLPPPPPPPVPTAMRWSTKINLYSLGRHFKNENKTYTIVQSYYWDNKHYKMYYTDIKIISKLLVQEYMYIPIRLQLMKVCALCTPAVNGCR